MWVIDQSRPKWSAAVVTLGLVGAVVPMAAGTTAASAATGDHFTCRASALRVTGLPALLSPVTEPSVANAAADPCVSDQAQIASAPLALSTLLTVGLASATTTSAATNGSASSSVANPTVLGSTLGVTATAANAQASYTCANGSPVGSSSSTVANLQIAGGTPITTSGPVTLADGSLASVALNQTISTPTSVVQRAVDITVLSGIDRGAEIVLGEAQAGVSGNPCQTSNGGGTGTGGGSGTGGTTGGSGGGSGTGGTTGGSGAGGTTGGSGTGGTTGGTGSSAGGASNPTDNGSTSTSTTPYATGTLTAEVDPDTGTTIAVTRATNPADPSAVPVDYRWNFGDGSPVLDTGTQDTVTHQYATPGLHTLRTMIRFSDGTVVNVKRVIKIPDYLLRFTKGGFAQGRFHGTVDIRRRTALFLNRNHEVQGWVKDYIIAKRSYVYRTFELRVDINGQQVASARVRTRNDENTGFSIKVPKSIRFKAGTKVTYVATYGPRHIRRITTRVIH